jgi:multiple sugar transport system ATP-binding protein
MFVAGFIGAPQMNMLPVTLRSDGDRFTVLFDGTPLPLPTDIDAGRLRPYEGKDIILGIRPENFHEFAPADIDASNVSPFAAAVELAEPMGSEVHLNLVSGGRNLVARVSPRFRAKIGDPVELVADLTNAQLFDPVTERSILY